MGRDRLKKLGQLLVEYNYITEEQLTEAISVQQKTDQRLGRILVELGYVNENDLIQILEFQLGIPHINLAYSMITTQMAQYIPEHIAKRYQAVAIERMDDLLLVAMSDPTDLVAIDDIELTSGLKVEVRIATKKEIMKAINQIYSPGQEETTEIFASLDDYQRVEEPELEVLKEMIEDAPIVRLANLIITQALQLGASDVHIEPQVKNVRIRYRIDGVLKENMTIPKHSQAALLSRLKIIANLDITKRRIPQDGRVEININGVKTDLRVSSLPTIFGEKIVIRLLTRDDNLIRLDNLGFSPKNYESFINLIERPHGILLLTGPTGSGKSTTLFAGLQHLNTPEKNIITIEDPVEYQLSGLCQVQAHHKSGLTFAHVLRSVLRQDPDIIMVGEIRDEETARISVRAALTGHLVLSTLHTNDATSSISRLLDMGIPSYLVASTVSGVIAQRLVRRLCKSCCQKYKPGLEEKEVLQLEAEATLCRPAGCKKCNSSGYKGRIAVQEVLLVDERIREMIVLEENEQDIKRYAIEGGMLTLAEDGKDKVRKGLTSYEELIRVII